MTNPEKLLQTWKGVKKTIIDNYQYQRVKILQAIGVNSVFLNLSLEQTIHEIKSKMEESEIKLGQQRTKKMEMHRQFRDIITALKKEVDPKRLGFMAFMEKDEAKDKLRHLVKKIDEIVIPKYLT